MQRIIWTFLGVMAISLSSCAIAATPASAPTETTPTQYTIVTSTSILADMTAQIVGNVASVTSLVAADSDAHVYEPSPADGITVAKASALVAHGLEFEPWFEELYAASGSSAPYIEASADITPIAAIKGDEAHADEAHADEAHADEAHGHGEFDPHVWQDVQHAIKMVEHITAELSTVMPEHATTMQSNAQAYIQKLNDLDAEIANQMAQIPESKRILITNHDTMSYFAQRYGLTIVGTVLGSVSTESNDPSANEIAQLVGIIKETGAPAIFVEAFGNDNLIATIASEAGVTVAPPLYTDALGATGSDGATYISMMRYNSQTIYQALGR